MVVTSVVKPFSNMIGVQYVWMYHQKVCSLLSLTKSGVTEQERFKDYWAHTFTRTEKKISMIKYETFLWLY